MRDLRATGLNCNMQPLLPLVRDIQQIMYLLFLIVSLVVQSVSCHPQCLDANPPFRPQEKITFCKTYSRLGCCTKQDDAKIKILSREALSKVPIRNRRQCKGYLSRVVCLQCHSWAAHIFSGAKSSPKFTTKITLPCLQAYYCKYFLKKCKNAISHIWGAVLRAKNVTLDNFCQEAKDDLNKDTCYPRITTTLRRLKNPRTAKWSNIAKELLGSSRGCLCVKEIAKDLRNPLALVHANDQTHRMFVVEQVGVVYVILHNGTKLKTPFLNITEKVLTTPAFGDERGLLGIVFHPKYRQNGRVFVYYITKGNGGAYGKSYGEKWWLSPGGLTVLSEFRVSKYDPNQVDPKSEKIILIIRQPASNHNGGQLLFGVDNYLYVFPGDGGRAGDPFGLHGNGLNKSTLLGKVLRLDIDKTNGSYEIPPDNPFLNESKTRPEIFAYGARNMWRCSVDRGHRHTGYGKGRIFCGDVGQDKYEEIDIIVKGGNYGWRGREGYKCYDRKICNSSLLANEVLPIHVYNHKVGQSIVGGYVYRGCNYPRLRGWYFFADTMNGKIFKLKEDKKTGKWIHRRVCMGDKTHCAGPKLLGTYAKMVLSFGEDEAGELYVLSTQYTDSGSKQGEIYQIVDPERRDDPSHCKYTVKEPANFGCKDSLPGKLCESLTGNACVKHSYFLTKYCKKTCKKC